MAPFTAIRGDHTMWQCMTTVNDEYCQVNPMFEFGQDDKGCAIRVPILGCPKCKIARRIGTLALRDNWETIGHLEDYTALGEEVWKYDVPYDVEEPDPVLYTTVACFGDDDIAYDRTASGNYRGNDPDSCAEATWRHHDTSIVEAELQQRDYIFFPVSI